MSVISRALLLAGIAIALRIESGISDSAAAPPTDKADPRRNSRRPFENMIVLFTSQLAAANLEQPFHKKFDG
jgi:hypothetical protein